MRRISIALAVLLFCSSIPVQGEENNIQIRGGGSVMMEMSTAVWCDICADHEEWIPQIIESNGERIIRVNLHSAINDPLGNEASNYRKGWLGQTDVDSTPSYHFDGVRESTPSSNMGELQRSLLDAEGDRIYHEVLDVSISFSSSTLFVQASIFDPILINSTSMTLMLLEKRATISPDDATNGKLYSDSVLKNIISVNSDESIMFPSDWASATFESNNGIIANFSFNWPKDLDSNSTEIVLIHEKSISNGERTTLSALSWTTDISLQEPSYSLWVPLMIIGLFIATIVYSSRLGINEQ